VLKFKRKFRRLKVKGLRWVGYAAAMEAKFRLIFFFYKTQRNVEVLRFFRL